MKKLALIAIMTMAFGMYPALAKGGIAPCLASIFLGDTRIGLYMNEGKPVEAEDWIVFVGNIVSPVFYAGIGICPSFLPEFLRTSVLMILFNSQLRITAMYCAPIGKIYGGCTAYRKSKKVKGFIAGVLWGRRVGSEITTTKVRTKEILTCIPVVNLYPCIALPLEAYSGKTMTQVIQEEGLNR